MKRRRKRLSVLILVFSFLFGMSGIGMANSQQQDLSPLTPQQQEAYNYLSSLPPGWLSLIADEFGIAESELIPLYNAGMNYGQIRDYLFELYPEPDMNFNYADYSKLSNDMNIDELDALKCYNLARKWRKDPAWIASLFKDIGNWDAIEAAFEKRYQGSSTSNEAQANISTRGISSIQSINETNSALQLSSLYNTNSQSIEYMLDSGASEEDVKDIMFFMEITSLSSLNSELNEYEGQMMFNSRSLNMTNAPLDLSINEPLEEGWTEELPEEINYLKETWPRREFPQELLPLSIPQSEQAQTRSLNTTLFEMPTFQIRSLEGNPSSEEPQDPDNPNPPPPFKLRDITGGITTPKYNNTSPFEQYFQGTSEDINPLSGSLLIKSTDFSLPGKYDMNFSFSRFFNSDLNAMKKVVFTAKANTTAMSISSGTTQNSVTRETAYTDGSKRVDIANTVFEYDAQTSDNGYVDGTVTVQNTAYFYRQGESTPYTTITTPSYTGNARMLPSPTSTSVDESVVVTVEPAENTFNIFGLGQGWGIDGIPIVEIVNSSEKYILLGSEGVYEIESDGYLVNRDSKDLKFSTDISYTYGGVKSSYSLYNINGTRWYFDAEGKPLACKDKYDQYIRLIYNSNKKVDKIIDTVGRVIKFDYTSTSIIVNVYESENAFGSLQTWTYNIQPLSMEGKNKLVSVMQPSGQQVLYTYEEAIKEHTFYYSGEGSYYTRNLRHVNLTSITHPTGNITHFVYDPNDTKVIERYDELPTSIANSNNIVEQTKIENRVSFVYNYNKSTKITITEKTVLRNPGEEGILPANERWEYDKYNRINSHKIVGQNSGDDRQKTETIETIYEYKDVSTNRPSSVKQTTTLSNSSVISEAMTTYIYDEYGNVILTVDPAGNKTEYTYDPAYNMLIEKIIYSSETEGIKITYTLDSDKKKVVSSEEAYARRGKNGKTAKHYLPFISVQKNPNTHIWSSTTEIQSLYLILRWSTGGWGGDSKYYIYYRKSGDTKWTLGYVSSFRDGGLISTIDKDYVTITLPESAYYDIEVYNYVYKNGYVQVMDGSYAVEPLYSMMNAGPSIYKTYEYDTNNPGNVIAENVYPLGTTTGTPETRTTYTYDTLWNAYPVEVSTQVTKADGSVSTVKQIAQYDKLGRTTLIKNEEVGVSSTETQYQYDTMGRVIKAINPPHSTTSTGSEQNVTYMDSLRQVQITDELGNVTRQTYDGLGRTSYTEWKDASNVWHIAGHSRYDSLGRMVSSFDANFNETKYEYDAFGRQIKTIAPDNTQTQNWYVGTNIPISENPNLSLIPPSEFTTPNLASWEKIKYTDGSLSYRGYDIIGRLVWTAVNPKTIPDTGVPAWDMTWYEYDKFDRVTKKAVNRTSTTWDITIYGYEYNNKPTVFTSPLTVDLPGDTEPVTVYEYNSRGLKTKEYPATNPSQAIIIEYDELGNPKRITYPAQQEYINTGNTFAPTISNVTRRDEFYYGIYGITRADSYVNNILENRYLATYNQRGWVTSEKWNINNVDYTFSYGYDAVGNRTNMTYPDATTNTYTYDELGRIVRIPGYFERENGQSGFAYDPVGNMTDIWATNGIHTQFSYNSRNMATSIVSVPLSLAYTYSGNGNITQIIDNTGSTPVKLNYSYDARGQLKTAQVNKPTGIETVSYSYDGTCNRISEIWQNNQNQILEQYSYIYQQGDYLMSKAGQTGTTNYTWDMYGQLSTKSSGEVYVFTGKRNLNAVINSNAVKEIYTYDALGHRLKVQNVDTITFNFPLGNDTSYEVKIEGSDTTVTKYISASGKYLAKTVKINNSPEQKYFHHIDLVGSIRSITDSTGIVIANYEYEPFGIAINSTGIDTDNLGFAGKRLDTGSGLSYFGARYYDTDIGRFISKDPIGDGRNWYIYCYNNPLVYSDPSGLACSSIAGYSKAEQDNLYKLLAEAITDDADNDDYIRDVFDSRPGERASSVINDLVKFHETGFTLSKGYAPWKSLGGSWWYQFHKESPQNPAHIHYKHGGDENGGGNPDAFNERKDGTPHHDDKCNDEPGKKTRNKARQDQGWKPLKVVAGGYIFYQVGKIVISILTAPITGGASLGLIATP